jgi:hypothetical protein
VLLDWLCGLEDGFLGRPRDPKGLLARSNRSVLLLGVAGWGCVGLWYAKLGNVPAQTPSLRGPLILTILMSIPLHGTSAATEIGIPGDD